MKKVGISCKPDIFRYGTDWEASLQTIDNIMQSST
jgi:hypothetical protein